MDKNARRRERYANDPIYREAVKANARRQYCSTRSHRNKLKQYGIAGDEYDRMLAAQDEMCAICGKHESEQKRRLAVDHCHTTGKVRGLLCDCCNSPIGKLQESEEVIASAIRYLREHNG